MKNVEREFDEFSASYEDLLQDPLRQRFSGGSSEFFHLRKRDLIREYFRTRKLDTKTLGYLDLGCGRGELISLLHDDFGYAAGCDPSAGMMEAGRLRSKGIETRLQDDPLRIPFASGQFDFVTAVCVYHHVNPSDRAALTVEARRVLRPGGMFAIIEHNPYNPATQWIVRQTPVDANAVLLASREARQLVRDAGFRIEDQRYFLYLPESFYKKVGRLESMLHKLPLGGQYAVFARASERQ